MTTLLFCSLFVLIVIGVPISIALGVSAMAVLVFFSDTSLMVLVQKSFSSADTFALMAIPFFILAGSIMASGGVSERLVGLANCGFGRFRGGLAQVTTVACAFFGAICGSGPATAAAIGSVMVKPMQEKGYDRDFTAGVIGSSGLLGVIIPPSNSMVIIGVITGASVGQMFIGGIAPGLIMACAAMVINYVQSARKNYPRGEKPLPGETFRALQRASLALLMPAIILGGIYAGVFTPTEAAVVAVVYGALVSIFIYRTMNFNGLVKAIYSAAISSASVMFLVVTAACFSHILASEQIPQKLTAFMLVLSQDPLHVTLLICVALLIIGTFLDNAVAIILTTPIFFPMATSLGVDPVFFGVLTTLTLAIGQVTPPVGLCLFVASSVAEESIEKVSVQIMPYVGVYILCMLLYVFFPQIITFLPRLMM